MIRKSELNDIKLICNYKLNMFIDSGHMDLLNSNAKDIIISKYTEMYKDEKAIHFLKEEDGKIVACCGAFIKDDIPYCFYKVPVYGFIGDVYTLPEYRNRGYASRLTDEAINWLKEKGVNRISLLAAEDARSIYERKGFKQSDEMILNNI